MQKENRSFSQAMPERNYDDQRYDNRQDDRYYNRRRRDDDRYQKNNRRY